MIGDEPHTDTQRELIEIELTEPDAAAVAHELTEAYAERHAAVDDEDQARRERRLAEHHERAAEELEHHADEHHRAELAHQRAARVEDHVTTEADVVEPEPLQLTGESIPPGGEITTEGDPEGFAAPAESSSQPTTPDGELIRLEDAVDALPALVRLAAGAWLRATAWGVGTSLRVGGQLARAATDPEAAIELYTDLSDGVRAYAREFLGITDIDERVRRLEPLAGSTIRTGGDHPRPDLKAQGEELLRHAADVGYEEAAHPAYARILTELSPDEARILRLLAVDGPQPMVDVRAQNLIGLGSQLVAPGLNMIGAQAGVRGRERVPAYLNNLGRLGLIYVSDDALRDPIAYQVLEAQPDVLGMIKDTPRAKSVHRSIRLSPFGQDFCLTCLPLNPLLPDPSPPQLPSGGVEGAPPG